MPKLRDYAELWDELKRRFRGPLGEHEGNPLLPFADAQCFAAGAPTPEVPMPSLEQVAVEKLKADGYRRGVLDAWRLLTELEQAHDSGEEYTHGRD